MALRLGKLRQSWPSLIRFTNFTQVCSCHLTLDGIITRRFLVENIQARQKSDLLMLQVPIYLYKQPGSPRRHFVERFLKNVPIVHSAHCRSLFFLFFFLLFHVLLAADPTRNNGFRITQGRKVLLFLQFQCLEINWDSESQIKKIAQC